MKQSIAFYCDLLGLAVEADFGANVTLSGGLSLQTEETWQSFIGGKTLGYRHNCGELYFETADFADFLQKLAAFDVEYVHKPLEHSWGQQVVRFYDPDGNIVEVAEDLAEVIYRFRDEGMNKAQIAERMDVPLEFIEEYWD